MSIVSYGTNNLRTKGEERDRAMRTRTVYLDDSSKALEYLRSCDERVAALIYRLGALAYDVYLDDYEFLVWQIVGQMISNQATLKIGLSPSVRRTDNARGYRRTRRLQFT